MSFPQSCSLRIVWLPKNLCTWLEMAHEYELHFVDLFKDIADKTQDIWQKIDGNYHLLNEKIENLQQQNEKLSKSLEEAQVEIAQQKDENMKLHAKIDILAALNGQMNEKFGEMSNEIRAVSNQNMLIASKTENLSQFESSSDETNCEPSSSNAEMKSNSTQLSIEMEDLKLEQKKIQEKICEIDSFQTNLNSKVEQMETQILANSNQTLEDNRSSVDLNMKANENQAVCFNGTIGAVNQLKMAEQQTKYKSHCFSWTINGINDILTKRQHSMESPVFPVLGYKYKAKANFTIKDNGYINVSLAFVDEKKKGKQISLKLIPKFTFTLKDLKGTDKDSIESCETLFASTLKYNEFNHADSIKHKSWLVKSNCIVNDSIVIDIAIDPPSVAKDIVSNDGIATVAIDNYESRKQSAIDRFQLFHSSPYFHTSTIGFRVKVDMYLNGYDDYEGKGLTVNIGFLTSENDSSWSHSFAHKTTIVVFNQLDSNKHYKKSVEKDIKDELYYFVDLLPHDSVENDGFVKDGTLYYKVIIERS